MNTEPKVVTLANLAQCTAQEVFDHVAFRLKQQGFKQSRKESSGDCMYRSSDGLACAAGHCMSEAEYARLGAARIENLPWGDLAQDGIVPDTHSFLIAQLQSAHDGGLDDELMVKKLKAVAKSNELSAAILGS